jgi:hypothetical protein
MRYKVRLSDWFAERMADSGDIGPILEDFLASAGATNVEMLRGDAFSGTVFAFDACDGWVPPVWAQRLEAKKVIVVDPPSIHRLSLLMHWRLKLARLQWARILARLYSAPS